MQTDRTIPVEDTDPDQMDTLEDDILSDQMDWWRHAIRSDGLARRGPASPWRWRHDVRAATVTSGDRSQLASSPANRAYTVCLYYCPTSSISAIFRPKTMHEHNTWISLCKQICQCCRILWFCVHNKQSNFMSSTGKTMCTFKVFG
jgi:hypothetical protein